MENDGQDNPNFPNSVEIEIIIVQNRFPLGVLVVTPPTLEAIDASGESPYKYLTMHCTGNWGKLCPEDWAINDDALKTGSRILSAYTRNSGVSIWIITEWDRSATTILLSSDY